ncbi:hypothetical protein HYU13_05910 [Candidatus Woesearchaeota archaeon]|nr:hypothetical protein [Candidatus Woesearchaeota archaeon]
MERKNILVLTEHIGTYFLQYAALDRYHLHVHTSYERFPSTHDGPEEPEALLAEDNGEPIGLEEAIKAMAENNKPVFIVVPDEARGRKLRDMYKKKVHLFHTFRKAIDSLVKSC